MSEPFRTSEFRDTGRIRFDVAHLFQQQPYWKGAADAGLFRKKKENMFACSFVFFSLFSVPLEEEKYQSIPEVFYCI
jgi:hypothetical protein